jgi:hypothetical protein
MNEVVRAGRMIWIVQQRRHALLGQRSNVILREFSLT